MSAAAAARAVGYTTGAARPPHLDFVCRSPGHRPLLAADLCRSQPPPPPCAGRALRSSRRFSARILLRNPVAALIAPGELIDPGLVDLQAGQAHNLAFFTAAAAAAARGLVALVVKDERRLVHAHPAQPLAVGLPRGARQVDLAAVLLLAGWLACLLLLLPPLQPTGGRCAEYRSRPTGGRRGGPLPQGRRVRLQSTFHADGT